MRQSNQRKLTQTPAGSAHPIYPIEIEMFRNEVLKTRGKSSFNTAFIVPVKGKKIKKCTHSRCQTTTE
jgi:hypothetical protein